MKIALAIAIAIEPKKAIAIVFSILLIISDRYNAVSRMNALCIEDCHPAFFFVTYLRLLGELYVAKQLICAVSVTGAAKNLALKSLCPSKTALSYF